MTIPKYIEKENMISIEKHISNMSTLNKLKAIKPNKDYEISLTDDPKCCDFCVYYNFNGDSNGIYIDLGYCRFHKRRQEPGDECDDFDLRDGDMITWPNDKNESIKVLNFGMSIALKDAG